MGQTTRRSALIAGTALGIAPLAACGGEDSQDQTSNNAGPPEQGARTPGPGQGGLSLLGDAGDVPVGGGKVYDSRRVVVTQPADGQFKAFSAVCTHAGCTVADVQNGVINCPCHRSAFSATDGSVRNGPATEPLAPRTISVNAGQIHLLD